MAFPQLICITAILFDLLPQTGNFIIYNTSLLKNFCTFASVLEINQIQCTTANIIDCTFAIIFDWLTKFGNFLNQFASLLETRFSATILESLQLHCITAKMMDFLPKLRNFFIYITRLLKNWFAAKVSETLELPASLLEIGFFDKNLELFWCIMHQCWNLGFVADIFEFLELHRIANKILDILPKSWRLMNYIVSLPKSGFSCQNIRLFRFTLHHC